MKETMNVKEPMNNNETGIPVDTQRVKIRALVSCIYDMQKMRISCGNRLVASFMQLGDKSHKRETMEKEQLKSGKASKNSDELEYEEDKEKTKMLKTLMNEYHRITDMFANKAESRRITDKAVIKAIEEAKKTGKLELIGTVYEFRLAETYNSLLETEQQASNALETVVKEHPMWDRFFKDVMGCGPMMAAVCISYFDIHVARHPSSFWKYAGLDVVDNEGRGKKHTEMREYIDRNNNVSMRKSLTYNPYLKSKLLGVLGPCIIKLSREKKEPGSTVSGAPIGYAKLYYDYRERLDNRISTYESIYNAVTDENGDMVDFDQALKAINEIYKPNGWQHVVNFHVDENGKLELELSDGNKVDIEDKKYSDLHKHRMATRYMIKQFVRDLWISWRSYEGYDIGNPYYEVAKLGHMPHGYNQATVSA